MESTKTVLDKLYEAVTALPPEAVERAKKELTRKGYDTTGYQYQFLVNVMNETLGIEGWGFDYEIVKEGMSKTSKGYDMFEVTVAVSVWIKTENGNATRKCVGGHQSMAYADAHKGAITNALKKTLGLFGVGKKAYEGTIDEDYQPIPEVGASKKVSSIDEL